MQPTPDLAPARRQYLEIFDSIVWLITHRTTRYVVAWLIALSVALYVFNDAWRAFDLPQRRDWHPELEHVDLDEWLPERIWDTFERPDLYQGNWGHATIDFGGQWLMGRMLVEGHGDDLYDRRLQRQVLEQHYRDSYPNPTTGQNDLKSMMSWLMGHDYPEEEENRETFRPVGGPLYPPINAFVAYPLARFSPEIGYRVNQIVNLVLAFVAGLAVPWMTRGRIWWPVAAAAILLYPGYPGTICLAQNATLTLTIALWGWACIARDRPLAAGMILGLLAFKPVWALAFFLPLVLSRRWLTALTMVTTGTTLAAATMPVVGWRSWMDWLTIGKQAAEVYKTDGNWIHYSRDVLSIPRRWLTDLEWHFDPDHTSNPLAWFLYKVSRLLPNAECHTEYWLADLIGWALVGLIVLGTAALAIWRWRQARATTGAVAAFLLLGAWLSSYHFMYYDVLLTIAPIFVLCADPRSYLHPRAFSLAVVPVSANTGGDDVLTYFRPEVAHGHCPPLAGSPPGGFRAVLVVNSLALTVGLCMFLTHPVARYFFPGYPFGTPWDTYCAIVLWLWCGWLWLWQGRGGKTAMG